LVKPCKAVERYGKPRELVKTSVNNSFNKKPGIARLFFF
jgi:hypothetical protein